MGLRNRHLPYRCPESWLCTICDNSHNGCGLPLHRYPAQVPGVRRGDRPITVSGFWHIHFRSICSLWSVLTETGCSTKTVKALFKALTIGIVYLFLSTVGVDLGSVLAYYALKPVLLLVIRNDFVRNNGLLSVRFFPFQALIAFACSWFLARRRGKFGPKPWVRFLWVVPGIWWILLFAGWYSPSTVGEARLHYFFWSRSREAFVIQVISTLPLISAIAFAAGNYCGSKNPSAQD